MNDLSTTTPALVYAGEAGRRLGLKPHEFRAVSRQAGFPQPVRLPGKARPMYRLAELLAWTERLDPVGVVAA